MIEAETIDAASTIRLLESLEAPHPLMAMIHVYLDNARYRHAKLVYDWLAQPFRGRNAEVPHCSKRRSAHLDRRVARYPP